MKSRFFFNAVLISLAAAFVLPLFSCSDASNDVGSGMVSFYVDKALMQKAVELSDKVSKNPNDDPRREIERKLRFEVALEGEYSETKTAYTPYEGDFGFESFSIGFDVPVGKTVWAKVKIYDEREREPVEERRYPTIYGKSSAIQVSSGINPLSVDAYSYCVYVPYKFTIQFDQEPYFSSCVNNYIYAVDPASKFVAKLRAAKDDVDRYEVCNQFYEKFKEDSWLGEMNLDYAELSYSEDRKTVTANGEMRMYVSEDDPASRAATALFVLICQNYDEDTVKTKYYGMASSAVTPMKKQDNMASISGARKLNVLDTPYALYKLDFGSFGYKYYIKDSPSYEVTEDTPVDYSSSGTSASVGNYKQSFCYDADGNFYTMSIYPEGAYDNFIYSSSAITGVNGYHFDFGCNGISCDLKTNKLYLLSGTTLYGTGDFIKTGTFNKVDYNITNLQTLFPDSNISDCFAIYDNVAYFVVTVSGYYIAKADLSKATADGVELERVAQIPVEEYVYPQISDMIAVDGSVYIIMRDITAGREDGASDYWEGSNLETSSVTSRGCVVKCDPAKGTCKKLGWNGNTTSKETLKDQAKMYFRRLGSVPDCSPDDRGIYKEDKSSLYLVDGSKMAKQGDTGNFLFTFFPDLQASFSASKEGISSSLKSCFASPAKFIAIKPKKLVISDDGIAFYTDNLGGLAYKNVDRVVTIDLQQFSIDSIQTASVPFERQLADWFSPDYGDYNKSLYHMVGGNDGKFYEYNKIFYKGSMDGEYWNVDTDEKNKAVFLAIKNGD